MLCDINVKYVSRNISLAVDSIEIMLKPIFKKNRSHILKLYST